MRFVASLFVSPDSGSHPAIRLKAAPEARSILEFHIPDGTGPSSHLITEFLGAELYGKTLAIIYRQCGVFHPIQEIELDDDDLSHLASYRVSEDEPEEARASPRFICL